ncbi:DNA cytosine methyltransferase [Halorientalis litorea]|uniref:DNA cytosine methyltransferase n=1 Tax=Halorientalis litorea TaxID=2931977 RepID=UPI001FF5D5A4|nr:DNA cytosine methyltransferase [Halorientalis litorea]
MSRGTVVDLFCGAGGASLGFVEAGFDVIGAVDIDEEARETYRKNLCDDDLVEFDEPMPADLTETSFNEIREFFDIEEGDVDVICGCPPCQNFSSLRDTEPWDEDEPKDELLREFVSLVREEKPDLVFFENVQGILTAGDEKPTTYIDWFKREMRDMSREDDESDAGYGINLKVVNAANYGVPQNRRRTIGICVYGVEDEEIVFPEPTHAEKPDEESNLEEWVTVNEKLDRDDLKQDLNLGQKQVGLDGYPDDPGHRSRRHKDETVEFIKAIRKHGDSWRDLQGTEDEDKIRDCHQNLTDTGAGAAYGIMNGDDIAPTLTTRCATISSGRFTHPEENRSLTFREAALLMTFPRWFELPEYNKPAERVVGNAVPPKLVANLLRDRYSPSCDEKEQKAVI